MKTERSLLALIVTVLLIHFAAAQTQNVTTSWFPLEKGREWKYTVNGKTVTEQVTAETTMLGESWFGISVNNYPPGEWYRFQSSSLYAAKWFSGSTISTLLHRFDAAAGDSIGMPANFWCDFGSAVRLLSTTDTVTVPAGTFTNCYMFKHDAGCMDGGRIMSWYAPGIGKVKFIENNIGGYQLHELVSTGMITGAAVRQQTLLPADPEIDPVFPNPFNPSTRIGFRLPEAAFVTVRIADVLGREVVTLLHEHRAAGEHAVDWNASRCTAGTYIASVIVNGVHFSQRLILLK